MNTSDSNERLIKFSVTHWGKTYDITLLFKKGVLYYPITSYRKVKPLRKRKKCRDTTSNQSSTVSENTAT